MREHNSVLVGMSGGVDSSVAAFLLREQGLEVTGATMRLYDPGMEGGACHTAADLEDAQRVAERLGVPHRVFDLRAEFRAQVMDRFARSYQRGETPNPCIDCNRYMKFRRMLCLADELGIWYVATGHYARRAWDGERWLLKKGLDRDKDQSYFLYHLKQTYLEHFQLPLGELTKAQVRQIAAEQGFGNAKKKDSQDICFVPDGDYGAFLDRYTGHSCGTGHYMDAGGAVLGTHRGHTHYTIGQRKGLELAMGRRVYVTGKDVERNWVYIGDNEDLFSRALEAVDLNLIACDAIPSPLRCTAKIRHSRSEAAAVAEQTGEDTLRVTFDRPQRAIAPGQSVVLYDGDVVIGGGTITRAL